MLGTVKAGEDYDTWRSAVVVISVPVLVFESTADYSPPIYVLRHIIGSFPPGFLT